jgi:amino acid adenylation domain-containing protein
MKDLMYQYLDHGVAAFPEHTAIEEPGKGSISYVDLNRLAVSLRDRLRSLGVQRGDRVGIYLHKSIDSIASIFGILKAGAAYVPVDPSAPVSRNAYILTDCSVKVIITEKSFSEALKREVDQRAASPHILLLDEVGGGKGLLKALETVTEKEKTTEGADASVSADDLAYILYTSGSTGKPKGVMLSHQNGASFVNWCLETFQPQHSDRFTSHAPFHFDLSILDIYVSLACGATLVLISEERSKDPARLAELISDGRITIWYSAPSILTLLLQYGNLEKHDCSSVRIVFFAGEVFPIKHLRALKSLIPHPKYFNLYGPTETNVCTYYEVPAQIPADRTEPFPIGKVCSHFQTKVADEDGQDLSVGQRGELCVRGKGVMQGYWNLPEQTGRAFLDASGERWYRTGDIVIEQPDGNYILVGRRDRMVKRRGYRVELGEIEAALYRHPIIKEAAVLAFANEETGVRIRAFLSCQDGKRPSTIEMKQFCMGVLPPYMVPDLFSFRDFLPKTSTDKIDYQNLKDSQ